MFLPKRTKIHVLLKAVSESREKSLIILSGVELLCTEKLGPLVFPDSLKEIDLEERLESGRNVLQKRKDAVSRMLVSEDVEYESVFGNECVSVYRSPFSRQCRLVAPR